MVDHEVVRRRLRQIDRRSSALSQIAAVNSDEFVRDDNLQAQAERHLQVAIQAMIDVALHILSEDTPDTPDDYGSAFVDLAQHGVISSVLADRLRLAAGLRNLLVHAYLDIDPARVHQYLTADLGDLTEFAVLVEQYIR